MTSSPQEEKAPQDQTREAVVSVDEDAMRMLAVAHGDESALGLLIDRWQRPLVGFFYRSLHSMHDAEDLAQTTFVRLYRAADRYEPRAKFSTYLFQIARRLLLNELRRRKRKPADPIDPEDFRERAADDPEKYRAARELESAFQEALADLPEKHRSALLLYKQQGLSYAEIADSLGTSLASVKAWIHRARQSLKTALKDYHEHA